MLCGAALMGAAGQAAAQTAPPPQAAPAPQAASQATVKSADQIETISVTARRRKEPLQKVPVSITVVSGARRSRTT
ncbi:MAG: hypothetical protein WDN04_28195 [Rhodospirillales bacterium]